MEPISEAATTEYSPLSKAAMERIISTTLPAAEGNGTLKKEQQHQALQTSSSQQPQHLHAF